MFQTPLHDLGKNDHARSPHPRTAVDHNGGLLTAALLTLSQSLNRVHFIQKSYNPNKSITVMFQLNITLSPYVHVGIQEYPLACCTMYNLTFTFFTVLFCKTLIFTELYIATHTHTQVYSDWNWFIGLITIFINVYHIPRQLQVNVPIDKHSITVD